MSSRILLLVRREGRLIFIDALRVSAILFVIIHHAAQAYGPTRGLWPVHDRAQSEWFAPFYTANSTFGSELAVGPQRTCLAAACKKRRRIFA